MWEMEQLGNCHRKAHDQRKGIVEWCIKVEWVCRGDNIKCMYGKLGWKSIFECTV